MSIEIKCLRVSQNDTMTKLAYCEVLGDPVEAITREKQIKADTRARKIILVSVFNPGWIDLYEKI